MSFDKLNEVMRLAYRLSIEPCAALRTKGDDSRIATQHSYDTYLAASSRERVALECQQLGHSRPVRLSASAQSN